MKNILIAVVGFIVGFIVLFVVYTTFVIVPVIFYTEAECLRNGYPRSRVTIGLERYCLTLDGAVTVKVTKQ